MVAELREALSHVRWIGGAPDAGKTSVARRLADAYGLAVYHYDEAHLRHHRRLAVNSPVYAAFLDASLDERWVGTAPEELAERAWQAFADRFPLVLEDLAAFSLPAGTRLVAEGFGLTPGLVSPLLANPRHAVWLMPTDELKARSIRRRGKGAFGGRVSDPIRATDNLRQRDRLLAERLTAEAAARGMTVVEVDGAQSVEALAAALAGRFGLSRSR
jgi:2-phosphoglycerate kinase